MTSIRDDPNDRVWSELDDLAEAQAWMLEQADRRAEKWPVEDGASSGVCYTERVRAARGEAPRRFAPLSWGERAFLLGLGAVSVVWMLILLGVFVAVMS